MIVVLYRDNLHVSYLVRTPAKKPGHDVLALPVSPLVQVPRLPPNLQPLFEGEFERNAAAFGAVSCVDGISVPIRACRIILAKDDLQKLSQG
jgi:hypothetical protein